MGEAGEGSAQDLERARALAYRHLAQRDRTRAEVRRHLARSEVDEKVVDLCVGELCELGYLDDARFAVRFVEDRRALDGWGSQRIRERLDALGVEAKISERAVAREAETEAEAALAVLHRRLGSPPRDERARRRALGLLVRRGYELELAYTTVRRFAAQGD